MKLPDLHESVIDHYKLKDMASPDGYVFKAVKKGMYGLPQSGILAQELLEKRLNDEGYHQSKFTPGLWTHEWRPLCFTLVVDDCWRQIRWRTARRAHGEYNRQTL